MNVQGYVRSIISNFCFNCPQFEKKNKPENVTYVSDGQANSLLVRKDYLYLISNVLPEYWNYTRFEGSENTSVVFFKNTMVLMNFFFILIFYFILLQSYINITNHNFNNIEFKFLPESLLGNNFKHLIQIATYKYITNLSNLVHLKPFNIIYIEVMNLIFIFSLTKSFVEKPKRL